MTEGQAKRTTRSIIKLRVTQETLKGSATADAVLNELMASIRSSVSQELSRRVDGGAPFMIDVSAKLTVPTRAVAVPPGRMGTVAKKPD